VTHLGRRPEKLKPATYAGAGARAVDAAPPALRTPPRKETVGVDVFLDWTAGSADDLARQLAPLAGESMKLSTISNRGIDVWPGGFPETFLSDHWRCRFLGGSGGDSVAHAEIVKLLGRIAGAGFDFIKIENLCTFDGQKAYSGAD
jgi:isocitrate dehydrogenase